VVALAVLLPSIAWCIPHLGVSCVNHNSSRIGTVAHNSNRGNSSISCNNSNNNSSTMLLLHCHSRLPPGRHSSFPSATFHASIAGRWATLLENAASPSKATHHELRHPWSTNRGAIRRALHHGPVTPTTPSWRRSPREKKCQRVRSSSMNIPLLFCSILKRHMIL
jgi:hypothetical protein